jgi:hypothetical protein
MNEPQKQAQPAGAGGIWGVLWQRKVWWLWPLIVLLLLIAVIYVLAHLSAADPETYPTTMQEESIDCVQC